jgi:N-methylhydantoinase B
VEVITPPGTIVNPRFPAPVSNANINTAQRIADVVLGALSQALPQRVPAASSGSMGLFTIGGLNPRSDSYYSYVETYGGGQGAVYNQDGMDGVHTNMTNTLNTPVEVIEIAYPLRVERYGLVPDTDGPGRFRGGLGLTRELTVLDHSPVMSWGSDRNRLPPWGLADGKPGGKVSTWLERPDGTREPQPGKVTRPVPPGTKIVLRTAGGGGYGDPMARDPESVAADVREGLISGGRAKTEYGVVVDPADGTVDRAATAAIRDNKP